MRDLLFPLHRAEKKGLQTQLREQLVSAILAGQIPPRERLPSSRRLAKILGVSRNTVTLTYQSLIDDGFLVARERSGYFVNERVLDGRIKTTEPPAKGHIDWSERFRVRPSRQANINKPPDWAHYPYPFIYGQVDQKLFPVSEWRDCSRRAHGRQWLDRWTADHYTSDDPMLIEQIRTRLLPRRGIRAREDEILVTIGAQQALYLLAALLVSPETRVALEEPGYPDVRNIFGLKTAHLVALPVDDEGAMPDERLRGCRLVYVTPSHQFPTAVTMSAERRRKLLELAARLDFIIIEDDYEPESNFVSAPTPALKASDAHGRVVYVGSLSKTLFPGLRLGYVVADAELIGELRALRRLMVRHPPNIEQRTAALFLALGHHDALLMRLRRAYSARWHEIRSALAKHMPHVTCWKSTGGSAVWLEGPQGLDCNRLARQALAQGVVIEPGDIHFATRPAPSHCFRLGFSSIETERIEEGIRRIAGLAETLT